MAFKNLLAVAVGVLAATAAAHPPSPPKPTHAPSYGSKSYINFTTVTGVFLQDEPTTDPNTFDYTAYNFGLLNRTYPSDKKSDKKLTQWQRFEKYVDYLNAKSGRNVDYKVIFMGRHGEGYHNAAESYFGTPAWNCYWSLLDGNATVTWADALVTPLGVEQAKVAARYWLSRIKLQKIPLPGAYYTSPLSRCLETARLTFAKLPLPRKQPFVPVVKEYLREGISGHTCDRRRSKSYIKKNFPGYKIERGFTEKDQLFRPLFQEGGGNQDIRNKPLLDEILTDKATWISFTSHSGEIASLLRVLKHREFRLATGGVIPVLVKVETIRGTAPPATTTAWQPISTCASAPTTAAPTPTA